MWRNYKDIFLNDNIVSNCHQIPLDHFSVYKTKLLQ